MDKIKFVLSIWTKLATHIRMRDRSVKILQYGCQMLLGFYATKFSSEIVEALQLTKAAASTSRKAFWLLKSVNHIGVLIDMLETYDYAEDEGFAVFFDILEQVSLIIYYWYENLVFLSRTKLISTPESSLDRWGNPSWFFEDFTCFIAAFIRTVLNFRKLRSKENNLGLIDRKSSAEGGVLGETSGSLNLTLGESVQMNSPNLKLIREIKVLRRQFWDSVLSLFIVRTLVYIQIALVKVNYCFPCYDV